MADAKKKKFIVYTSPKSVAKYCHINTPQTKYKKEGEYSVNQVFDPNDAAYQEFKARVLAAHEAAVAIAREECPDLIDKTKLFKADTKKDEDGNKIPTGMESVKFAHVASGKKKDGTEWAFKPALFDAGGKPLQKGTLVCGGSVVKVSYGIKHTLMPTGDFYTSLPLQAVQVLKLVDSYAREASEYGFGSEEGYEAEEDAFGEQVPEEAAAQAVATDVKDF